MLDKFKPEKDLELEKAIASVYESMHTHGPDSEEYKPLLEHLKALKDMKSQSRRKPISSDTLLMVAGNLAGILVVVHYERAAVVTSKALGFVMRAK